MMHLQRRPRRQRLDRAECRALLARNQVGRLAFAWKHRTELVPLHYAYHDGWIYGRIDEGAQHEVLCATQYRWWPVAFEVGEPTEAGHWRSVVVHGGFYVLHPQGPAWERAEWRKAERLLRRQPTQATSPADAPAGEHLDGPPLYFRIAVQQVRACELAPGLGTGSARPNSLGPHVAAPHPIERSVTC